MLVYPSWQVNIVKAAKNLSYNYLWRLWLSGYVNLYNIAQSALGDLVLDLPLIRRMPNSKYWLVICFPLLENLRRMVL